jgi:hypothetical protein
LECFWIFSLKNIFSDAYVIRVTPDQENASEKTLCFHTIMKKAAMLTNSGCLAYRLSGSSEMAGLATDNWLLTTGYCIIGFLLLITKPVLP